MILVIDNYDSFTYNLVQYLGELGEEVIVRRNDETTLADIEANLPSRILISPGPGRPEDAGISSDLINHFGDAFQSWASASVIKLSDKCLADGSCARLRLYTARTLKFSTMASRSSAISTHHSERVVIIR